MKNILILLSFLMALNFVASTYYGSMVLNSEELAETNPLQEILEKHVEKYSDFILPSFRFISTSIEIEKIVFNRNRQNIFSSYEQVILVPPPDFLRYSA